MKPLLAGLLLAAATLAHGEGIAPAFAGVDFRAYSATLLDRHWGNDPGGVLGGRCERIAFI